DVVAIETRARTLCERLERVLREGEGADSAAAIAEAWTAVSEKSGPALVQRYTKARELYDLSRDPQRVADLRQRKLEREQLAVDLADFERDLSAGDALNQRESLTERFV